ncbi:MAG TPA: DUF1365 domain-containing protein [Alphaproteobacteria bacterium]|nr:DUF1365 domain-containing protein [Alphaproteobacteria bacterium]
MKGHYILDATVVHNRHVPINYPLSHRIAYFLIDMGDLSTLDNFGMVGLNRSNFLSFYESDYGVDRERSWRDQLYSLLQEHHQPQPAHIMLLTLPRLLGYVFNPVSFWLCFDDQSNLYAVLAEVNNTFGERHGYLCYHHPSKNLSVFHTGDVHYQAPVTHLKTFHVSPFCDVRGYYDFRFNICSNRLAINIDYYVDKQKTISTALYGTTVPMSNLELRRQFLCKPWQTIKVIFFIHYHALRLWIKGMRYRKKPTKPKHHFN